MAKYKHPLEHVKIASPCSADWERMMGDERRRFCGQCELNVYNLSGMTRSEAEELINRMEGRLCVRFYRRADGTVLTKDCPVGLQAIRRRLSRLRNAVVSSVLSFLAGLGIYAALPEMRLGGDGGGFSYHEPVTGVLAIPPKEQPVVGQPALMGGATMSDAVQVKKSKRPKSGLR